MTFETWFNALLMGIVEGLTEFIPVSSTGHLLLMNEILSFQGPQGHVFEVVIQLGAILAVISIYFQRLWGVLIGLPTQARAQRFASAVTLAFLPAAVIGFFAHEFIKTVLFNPVIVSIALIVGGLLILLIEKKAPEPKIHEIEEMPWKTALSIGFAQCLAMIPGVSRSGATIMGSLLFKVERRAATEFSFFLAIPTMTGAAAYDIYKNIDHLTWDDGALISIGFVSAFAAALLVVKTCVAFISKHGFAPFAWYRIALGSIALALLTL